ncbi:MAG TPA: hypothetical protein VGR57_05980, partial [Ktedonobacterales bacterium]|nr:hypothetical protein [Ktedonobacterales bacterium]
PWASPLADALVAATARHDATAPVLPFMLYAVTDAKHLVKLPSLRHLYGYNPLRAPRGFSLPEQLHAVDERVPADGVIFGARVMTDLVRDFCARA